MKTELLGKLITMGCMMMVATQAAGTADAAEKKSERTFDPYRLTWNSPSKNSKGSMPIGNGDIGANI